MLVRCAGLIVIATLSISLIAQERNEQARSLLLRSYALAQHVPASERIELLTGQVRVAGKLDASLTAQWAEELFEAAKVLPENARYWPQQSAVSAMTTAEPLRAYQMARQIKRPKNYGLVGTYVDFGMSEILISLLKQQGVAALPTVRSILRDLSGTREFPYRGVETWLRSLQERPAEARELFNEAVRSYSAAPENAPDFTYFLRTSSPFVPPNVVRPVLSSVVTRLLEDSASSSGFYGRIICRDGSMVEFRRPTTATLMHLLPTIESLDPGLHERVLASRPELVRVARGESNGLQTVTAYNAGPNMLEDFGKLADPEKALLAARAKPEPEKRARALIEFARQFYTSDSSRQQEILTEATALVSHIQSHEEAITVLASIAESALRAGCKELALSASLQGLSRAQEINAGPNPSTEDLIAHRRQFAIVQLAEVASAVDVNVILERVEAQSEPSMQARLLLQAASGILRGAEEDRHQAELQRLRRSVKNLE